jgi:hypothetical protein
MLVELNTSTGQSAIIAMGEEALRTYAIARNKVLYMQSDVLYEYVKNKSEIVHLENVVLPDNIAGLVSDYDSENIVLTTESSIYFLNVEESFLDKIGDYKLVSSSTDNKHLLIRSSDGSLSMIDIEISKSFKSFDFLKLSAEIDESADNISSIIWSSSNNYFVMGAVDGKKIYSLSASGNNKFEIFEYTEPPLSYAMTSADDSMILLLKDTIGMEGLEQQANLYELQF